MSFLPIFIAAAVDVVAGVLDAVGTESCIKKGVAVEGNKVIDAIFGVKPSAVALYAYNFVYVAGIVGAAAALHTVGGNVSYISYGGAIAALVVDAIKHVQEYLKCRYLLAGGKIDPDGFPLAANGAYAPHSAIQKFIGPWYW